MLYDVLLYLLIAAIVLLVSTDLYKFLNAWFTNPKMSLEMLKANPFGSIVFPLVLIIIWFIIFGWWESIDIYGWEAQIKENNYLRGFEAYCYWSFVCRPSNPNSHLYQMTMLAQSFIMVCIASNKIRIAMTYW